uniref:VPS9 domain-containing protein n=1 Tax=Chrysotila carterae TaxID=13221 RepID=A0A7S4BF85_CHRCT
MYLSSSQSRHLVLRSSAMRTLSFGSGYGCYSRFGHWIGGALGVHEYQANTPRLHTNMAYASRWRSPVALKSEAGCYFTHMQAAVSFLEGLAEEDETSGGQAVWKEHSDVPSTQQVPPLHSTGGGTALQGSGSSSSEGSVQADSGVHEASTRANVCDGGLQAMAGVVSAAKRRARSKPGKERLPCDTAHASLSCVCSVVSQK